MKILAENFKEITSTKPSASVCYSFSFDLVQTIDDRQVIVVRYNNMASTYNRAYSNCKKWAEKNGYADLKIYENKN